MSSKPSDFILLQRAYSNEKPQTDMTLIIEHDGTRTEFPDDSLLIFVDETGHEDFADPNTPYFGLAGCVCAASDYWRDIDQPWIAVEQAFPEDMRPLMRRKTPTSGLTS
ncbi:MAG: DUF3800 domain-containing protein [Paracoccaceae bacterium]